MARIRQERQQQPERLQIAASITNYYDSMSDKGVEEDRAWGQFAETQIADKIRIAMGCR